MTLASALRSGIDDDDVWDHAQRLPGGLAAIVGPDLPDQANAVLTAAGARLGSYLGSLSGVDVIADLGRSGINSQSPDLLTNADLVLMVARPIAEQLQPAAQRLRSLGLASDQVGWVLVGERPHDRAEVEAAFGIGVVGVIADDSRGAAALANGASPGALRRSSLARSAFTLAETLAARFEPTVDEPVPIEPAMSLGASRRTADDR